MSIPFLELEPIYAITFDLYLLGNSLIKID